jgi:hypothetical protein
MTQYDYLMRRKREELAAEEWGNKIASIHAFNTEQVTMGMIIDLKRVQ